MNLVNLVAASAAACSILASTALGADIPKKKQSKAGLYVTASEANNMLQDDAVIFIDIRSRAEVAFLGMPVEADINIPYMIMPMLAEYDDEKQGYSLEVNPDFPNVFSDYAEENNITTTSKIILMCRSGSRSARAADLLFDMGYTNVYSVVDGYEGDKSKDGPSKGQRTVNGWKNDGLQWSYSIRPDQVYPDDRS